MAITSGNSNVAGLFATEYIIKKFLPMLKAELCFAPWAHLGMIPKGEGKTIQWLLPAVLSGTTATNATTPLTEVTQTLGDVEFTDVTVSKITAAVGEHGTWMKIGDLAKEAEIVTALDMYGDVFLEHGTRTIDSMLQAAALTTTNFIHSGDSASGGAALTVTDTSTAKDFKAISGFFYGQNAKGFSEIGGDFAWICHPNQETQFTTHVSTSALSWSDVKKHTAGEHAFDDLINTQSKYIGRLAGTSAYRSTQIGTVVEDTTAYQSVALAKHGIGWAGLGESGPKKPDIIIKNPGPQDTSNPLNLYGTIAWKFKGVGKLLSASRSVILYSAI